jgi:hypothetical protein
VDDDAFVVHDKMLPLLRRLDPARRALYGQRCSENHFCGGAGWVIHWDSLELMKQKVLQHCGPGSNIEFYDVCFPHHMGIEFVETRYFFSQPPWDYKLQQSGVVMNVMTYWLSTEEEMKNAVTYHYVSNGYRSIQERIDSGRDIWPWDSK